MDDFFLVANHFSLFLVNNRTSIIAPKITTSIHGKYVGIVNEFPDELPVLELDPLGFDAAVEVGVGFIIWVGDGLGVVRLGAAVEGCVEVTVVFGL